MNTEDPGLRDEAADGDASAAGELGTEPNQIERETGGEPNEQTPEEKAKAETVKWRLRATANDKELQALRAKQAADKTASEKQKAEDEGRWKDVAEQAAAELKTLREGAQERELRDTVLGRLRDGAKGATEKALAVAADSVIVRAGCEWKDGELVENDLDQTVASVIADLSLPTKAAPKPGPTAVRHRVAQKSEPVKPTTPGTLFEEAGEYLSRKKAAG